MPVTPFGQVSRAVTVTERAEVVDAVTGAGDTGVGRRGAQVTVIVASMATGLLEMVCKRRMRVPKSEAAIRTGSVKDAVMTEGGPLGGATVTGDTTLAIWGESVSMAIHDVIGSRMVVVPPTTCAGPTFPAGSMASNWMNRPPAVASSASVNGMVRVNGSSGAASRRRVVPVVVADLVAVRADDVVAGHGTTQDASGLASRIPAAVMRQARMVAPASASPLKTGARLVTQRRAVRAVSSSGRSVSPSFAEVMTGARLSTVIPALEDSPLPMMAPSLIARASARRTTSRRSVPGGARPTTVVSHVAVAMLLEMGPVPGTIETGASGVKVPEATDHDHVTSTRVPYGAPFPTSTVARAGTCPRMRALVAGVSIVTSTRTGWANLTMRDRVWLPPGTRGSVTVISTTPVPVVTDGDTRTCARPVASVVFDATVTVPAEAGTRRAVKVALARRALVTSRTVNATSPGMPL